MPINSSFSSGHIQPNRRKSPLIAILLVASLLSSLFTFTPPPLQRAYAIDAPTLLLPVDGDTLTATGYNSTTALPPLAIPEFSWTAVEGATAYRLQISQDIAFTVKQEFTTPHTTYIPITVTSLGDGIWYWRVRVDGPSASLYSGIFSFTKQWATPDNIPVLSFPMDQAQIDFADAPAFSWQPVLGAARYRFEIASSPSGFASPVYSQLTLAFTHQPPTKLANGTYYWRVMPLDPADHAGVPSEVRQVDFAYGLVGSFPAEIPVQLDPKDKYDPQYQPPTFTPTFRWTAVRGAQQYRLEYTSDPTCNFGVAGYTTSVTTPNTSYTPTSDFPNDVNYCWRVRAQSGNSISDWSDTWEFLKQWYIQAELLTPVNNYQNVRNPYFSWTPVPGAANYKIEVSQTPSFPPVNGFSSTAVNPYYGRSSFNYGGGIIWYWRVTPYDRSNNAGRPSSVFSFVSYNGLNEQSQVPSQIYPFYYYQPNSFPPPNESVAMQPYEDHTVSMPVFMWHRAFDLTENEAPAYMVQVDNDPLFLSVNWEYKTENLNATPSSASPFNPTPGTVYYWRVCALVSLAATNCQSPWSQIWPVRFDPALALPATVQATLLRPLNGFETVETMPLFEWQPIQGAGSYQVQVSQDPNFVIASSTTISETVPYPAYSPPVSLAKRSVGHLNYGTYYWRVRGLAQGVPGAWSSPWRFQLASQSQWRAGRALGAAENQLLVASDPLDLGSNTYELTNLYSSQDIDYWYFGFTATTGMTMTYGLYLDLDHAAGSGAATDARSFNVTTIPAHKPEYAIYILKNGVGTAFSADRVVIYRWTGTGWANNPQMLSAIGGALSFASNYLEVKVPNTAIGMQEETGSVALSLFSVDQATGNLQDSVPSSTSLALLDRFTSVSERLNLRMPPTNASGDPTKFAAVPAFFFDYPPKTPWEGFNLKITLDPQFTTWVRDYVLTASTPYLAPPGYVEHTAVQDINGDNTYYWRVRPQYYFVTNVSGAWSLAGRFERQGFVPQELSESVDFATPTFTWSMVEGAEGYDLQVDDDPNFGTPAINQLTSRNTYTPITTLADGTYYWRVRARRNPNLTNDWTDSNSLTVTLPSPANLSPNDPLGQHAVPRAPTLCWEPVVRSVGGHAVLAAYKYRLQVSGDPTFSTSFDTMDTEQACWTPTRGYPDGKFYWRVAMMDGLGKLGPYSQAAEFTKQYPTTTLVSPLNTTVPGTPIFTWTPVDGAASYKFEVSLYSSFSPTYDSVTTNDVRYKPTKVYTPNVVYYWRVAIVDKDNRMGPFTGSTIILTDQRKVFFPIVKK